MKILIEKNGNVWESGDKSPFTLFKGTYNKLKETYNTFKDKRFMVVTDDDYIIMQGTHVYKYIGEYENDNLESL